MATLHRPGNTKTGSGATAAARASHQHYQKLITALVDGISTLPQFMVCWAQQPKTGCRVAAGVRRSHGCAQEVCLASVYANMHTASVHNTFVSAASVPYMPQSAWAASGSFKRRRPLVRRACAVPPARAVHVCSARCTPHNERGACAAQPCTPRQMQRFWLNIVKPSAAGPLASTATGVLPVACPCSDDARLLQCTYS